MAEDKGDGSSEQRKSPKEIQAAIESGIEGLRDLNMTNPDARTSRLVELMHLEAAGELSESGVPIEPGVDKGKVEENGKIANGILEAYAREHPNAVQEAKEKYAQEIIARRAAREAAAQQAPAQRDPRHEPPRGAPPARGPRGTTGPGGSTGSPR